MAVGRGGQASGATIAGVRAKIVMLGWLVAGCSVQNPWFGLAGESEGTSGATGTGVGPGGETLLPTTQGPGGSTEEPVTTAVTTSTGPLTATEAGTTTGTDTSAGTGMSTGTEDTGMMPVPDLDGLCGNGVQDPNEECDDGNADRGDACESNCRRMFRYLEIEVGTAVLDIAAADLDGDGRMDLVVSHAMAALDKPDYSVLLNAGEDGFEVKPQVVPGWTGAPRVLVGQLVGDDRPDLLLVGAAGNLQMLANFSQPGALKFNPVNTIQGQPPGLVPAATLADLDANGFVDLLLVSGESLYVYANNEGSLMLAAKHPVKLNFPIGVAAGAVIANDPGPHVVLAHASPGDDRSGFINNDGVLMDDKLPAKLCPNGASSLNVGDADMGGALDLVFGCVSGRVTVAGVDAIKPYVRMFDSGMPGLTSVGVLDLYGDDEAADVYGFSTSNKALVVGLGQDKQFVAVHIEVLAQTPGASVAARIDEGEAPDIAVVLPVVNKVGVFINQTRLP